MALAWRVGLVTTTEMRTSGECIEFLSSDGPRRWRSVWLPTPWTRAGRRRAHDDEVRLPPLLGSSLRHGRCCRVCLGAVND